MKLHKGRRWYKIPNHTHLSSFMNMAFKELPLEVWDIIFGYLHFPDRLSLAKSSLQVHVPISSNISISILIIIREYTKPLGQRLNFPTC